MSKTKNPRPNPETSQESNEEWRPIRGFEGLYEVSSLGRVRSLSREVINPSNNGCYHIPTRIKKTSILSNGYEFVVLYHKGKPRMISVHRLVATTFLPNPRNNKVVDHINTIKTDNRVANLRWCSTKENSRNPLTLTHISKSHIGKVKSPDSIEKWKKSHAEYRKTEQYKDYLSRQKKRQSKPVRQFDKQGTLIALYNSIVDASKSTGAPRSGIIDVLSGRRKTSGGFIWKYQNTD